MKSEDMKMEKFKILISDIDDYLWGTSVIYHEHPLLYLIDEKSKESWLECILENSYQIIFAPNCSLHINLCEIEKNNTMEFIREIRKCDCDKGKECNAASHLMFWLLFAISVDNENYNNNLNVAADVAFLLDFDEETLSDWITAVKGVLSGKNYMNLSIKQKMARDFL